MVGEIGEKISNLRLIFDKLECSGKVAMAAAEDGEIPGEGRGFG